jgi:hypothetical protein
MNIEILNWLGPPGEGNKGGLKKTRGDEPIGVIIHILMEVTQGNSLYSYLYLKLAKKSCFYLYFPFYKIR